MSAIKEYRLHRNNHASKIYQYGFCFVCGCKDPEHYMVRDEIWHKVVPDYVKLKKLLILKHGSMSDSSDVLMCLDCLQARLGRELCEADFTETLINREILRGIRMGRRCQ